METTPNSTNSSIRASNIAKNVSGKLFGPDNLFTGIFNILGDSNSGDMVIRHWINEQGVEMAAKKGVCGIITTDAREGAVEYAIKHGISLILVEKIEVANAFAIAWTVNRFAPESRRIVITGTNGKSTTTHMIYHILKTSRWSVYTNTDSKSEFNTLIDPMVAKQISEFALNVKNNYGQNNSENLENFEDLENLENRENTEYSESSSCGKSAIDALIIEVSEVQGWLDKVMKNHAFLMTKAIDPNVVVITNVALDHIGLVNSIEEAYDEISGAVKAINTGFVVLNSDDHLVKKMADSLNTGVIPFYHGSGCDLEFRGESGGIYFKKKLLIETDKLPFKSQHFIENTLSAISACISLELPLEDIVNGVTSYRALNRRFSIINESPRIIDDFAHNPDGIRATIKSAASLTNTSTKDNNNNNNNNKLWVVCSIRGSRGDEINYINSQALSDSLNELKLDFELVVSASSDVVDNLNVVEEYEKKIFLETLESNQINYIFKETLESSLKNVLLKAKVTDTILLIGAQGMDPASELIDSF
ncbi:MAG TPA: Mur ligase family protein [Methanobacteriaceae archaeon]|nr:Mur ligase family protein [Methanobacteriaceae archaeon]